LSALSISYDRRLLAAANHDFIVSIYNITDLYNTEALDEEEKE